MFKLSYSTGTRRIEKHLLRQAFADQGVLPEDVLWRQKEQFSDGVGYGWIDALKQHARAAYGDPNAVAEAARQYDVNPPASAEALWYRRVFDSLFPNPHAAATVPGGPSVACSSATAIRWDPSLQIIDDQSGRAVHLECVIVWKYPTNATIILFGSASVDKPML